MIDFDSIMFVISAMTAITTIHLFYMQKEESRNQKD
jgi:hypothetical protein